MKLIKHYKYIGILSIVLLVFILIILFKSDITIFKSDKKTSSGSDNHSINTALIIDSELHKEEISQLKQSVADCSDKYDKKYSVFKTDDYNGSYEKTIDSAIKSGATLIICPDSTFEETVYDIQNSYIGVYFLIIDGIPHNSNASDATLNFNSISLTFSEAELGFLAGYAAVYEGYSKLSFVGVDNDIKSLHYYYGFLQGADYAAKDTNLKDIHISSTFTAIEDYDISLNKAYATKPDVMIICDEELVNKSLDFATENDVKVIACDDSYPKDSENIIANTFKNYYLPIYDYLTKFYKNNFEAGKVIEYSTSEEAVSLIYNTSSFTKFDSKIYDSIYQKLASDEIQIISDTTVSPEEIGLTNIKLD